MDTVPYVDLERFMGDWYVLACIPTFIERRAFNPVESYVLRGDGCIATTFTFNQGGFDGPRKTYRPTGYVLDRTTNARWGMQFLWPIKADYRIVRLDDDYGLTVIAREKRDHAWVMGRTASAPGGLLDEMRAFLAGLDYPNPSRLVRMPHGAA